MSGKVVIITGANTGMSSSGLAMTRPTGDEGGPSLLLRREIPLYCPSSNFKPSFDAGIGKETARVLALRGAHVILACRNAQKAQQAVTDIVNSTQNQNVEAMALDLNSFDSVRQFAVDFQAKELPLHVLINNAGIMACPFATTADGYESQFAVCHLAHFLLTGLLLPNLKASAPSRIVVLSSLAHKYADKNVARPYTDSASYSRYTAYANAKMANLMFARTLGEKLRGSGVICNAVHPGVIQTELTRSDNCAKFIFCIGSPFNKNIQQGAATTVFAACHPTVNGCQGAYFVDCNEKWPSKLARNDDICQELWDVSEQMTGISY
jgi:NAD(P)-dependent dehydrogenase (short-subunit alcohol dehydrogenase family)